MSNEPEFYRPDETDRLARAKEWLRVARGGEKPPRKADLMTGTHTLAVEGRAESEAE
jgi:hypothetical protein